MNIQTALLRLSLVSLLALSAVGQEMVRPLEGQVLDHIHTRFRWKPIDGLIGRYFLQVVEDNGSQNPFQGTTPSVSMIVPGRDPRIVITDGLEFGKNYAWRVLGLVPPLPGRRFATPVYRFSTITIPDYADDLVLTVPPGAGPMQPGLTMFNRRIGGNPAPTSNGFLVAVDENGEYVWFYRYDSRRLTDARQQEDGRFFWLLSGGEDSPLPGRMVEMTLDGLTTWLSPGDPSALYPHHECSRLPNGHLLTMVFEHRNFPGMTPSDFLGDRIIEMDRHTYEVRGEWNTFDHFSLGDLQSQFSADDWTHGNAAVYNEADDSVYFSARHLSRITRIDWTTKNVVYSLGADFPSGHTVAGAGLFTFQHAPEIQPNGNILLFNNGNFDEPLTDPRQSSAVEIAVNDPLNPTAATVAWRYDMVDDIGDPVFAPFLGDADRQPNGNTLMVAGPNGLIYEVDSASQLVWKLQVGSPFPDGAVYRAERIEKLVVDTPGDVDDDWDLDMHDLASLQNHFQTQLTGYPEKLGDTNADGTLDDSDFDHFFFYMSGPASLLNQFPVP